MIRLTHKRGVAPTLALAAIALCAPLAANAADAAFTDRIIVKYRGSAVAAAAQVAQQLRGTDGAAARLGVALDRVRTTGLGSQVLRVNRQLSLSEASRLAADIAA